jgi:DNA mismatch repair protein MutS
MPQSLLDVKDKITAAIAEDPPRELTEGGIFRAGFSAELDEIRGLLGGGKQWIEDLQKREQERTGIKSLKVNFNKTFGYYIEVTNANQGLVPEDYIRKQTLTNAERYITPDLKEYEAKILNAEKNESDIEYKMFVEFRKSLTTLGAELHKIATQLANLDALLSLAKVAQDRKFVCPHVDDSLNLVIKQGRHPVLEKILPMGKYVSNDVRLNGKSDDHQLIILTGPNMAGKSSYLRQVALIVILAQMGSFVPAKEAHVGMVDRIFTRIGAVDDLTQGQSTFLVEMSETTQCCLSATERSLILLDEVGRGTSTYDGVAIAWSVAEYLAKEARSRTIFATHYHELNGLAGFFPQIVNYQVLVKEFEGRVEFIRTVTMGGASRSFGVQVARMAGLPGSIIDRAQYLINQMEKKGVASKILDGPRMRNIPMDEVMQLSLFEFGPEKTSKLGINDVQNN